MEKSRTKKELNKEIAYLKDKENFVLFATNNHKELIKTLEDTLPFLIRLGDFIGNGDVDKNDTNSLGNRCDLILKIKKLLESEK